MKVAPTPAEAPALADLALRYGRGEQPERLVCNDVVSLLLSHKSVRAFLPQALPEGTLETLVAAAQSASNSSNLQTWSVVAVEDQGRKARLSEMAGAQKHITDAPLFLVWLADLSRLTAIGEARGFATEGLDYMETFIVGVVDAALAAQNAATALESLGLGCVYIGGMRNKPEAVAAELGLPPKTMAVFGMCVGYPDPARPAHVKPRLPQSAVLHREQYDSASQQDAASAYDETMRRFQEAEGMRLIDWTRQATTRVSGPGALSGRDRMREALANLGFLLK
jgi:nitroreductase